MILSVQFSWTTNQTTEERVDAAWRDRRAGETRMTNGDDRRTTEIHHTYHSLLTLKYDPPRGKEGREQGHAAELSVLPVVCVQTGQERLDGQVGEAVRRCSKHVGDAGVNVGVVAGVASELSPHGLIAHNVRQIIPEHEHLRQRESSQSGLHSNGTRFRDVKATRASEAYLRVSTHDLASLLVERIAVPLWVQSAQQTGQAVMFTQKQRVDRGQGDVLVHANIT